MDKLFAIYDRESQTYDYIGVFNHISEAKRFVMQILSNPTATISRYARDFDLVYIGSFTKDDGGFVMNSKNESGVNLRIIQLELFDYMRESPDADKPLLDYIEMKEKENASRSDESV